LAILHEHSQKRHSVSHNDKEQVSVIIQESLN